MNIEYRQSCRKIPDVIGNAVQEKLSKIDASHHHKNSVRKLKAIELCYSKRMVDFDIADELGVCRQTVTGWFDEITGPAYVEMSKQAVDRALRIIRGVSRVIFGFDDIYEESTREKYIRIDIENPKKRTPVMNRWKQGRKEFRSFMLRAGIDLACFTGPGNKFCFNEDGKELAIDVLINRTKRHDEDQPQTRYKAYQAIRSGKVPVEYYGHYKWMLDMACSNLRDIKDAYPDRDYPGEDDVIEEFWRNSCERNQGFDAFPGMSYLGELPQQLTAGWFFILREVICLDAEIKKEFLDKDDWDDEECSKRQERWITFLLAVLAIRLYEHEKIMQGLRQGSSKEVEEFYWLIDYFFAYENRYEDEGITKTNEEKWASKQLVADECLQERIGAVKTHLRKGFPKKDVYDSKRAKELFVKWSAKCKNLPRRLSTYDVIECANMLLGSDPDFSNKTE